MHHFPMYLCYIWFWDVDLQKAQVPLKTTFTYIACIWRLGLEYGPILTLKICVCRAKIKPFSKSAKKSLDKD